MPNPMRNNSIMDDPAPFQPPEIKEVKKPKKIISEQEKIRKHPKYPQLASKIAVIKEKHRLLLPSGTLVEESELSDEQLGQQWRTASLVLKDLDELETWLQTEMKMTVIQ